MKYKIFSFCQVMSLTIACATLTAPKALGAPSQTSIGWSNTTSETVVNDFALTDQNGRPFHLSQLRGKAVLLFFGYTDCPDACPTTMAKLSRVRKLLGSDAERAVTLFVSVDPGRDTPDVLKSYLAYFHINSVGLTGTKEDVDTVVKQYGARYEIEQSDSAAGYHVNHSTDLYLLNQQGELARTFGYSDSTQLIVDGIRQVIRSSSR